MGGCGGNPAIALNYLGKDPHSKNADDYKAAADLLKTVRPHVTRFSGSGSDYIDLASGGTDADGIPKQHAPGKDASSFRGQLDPDAARERPVVSGQVRL